MKSSPVVHFEMPAHDKKRMTEFYEKTFGWKMQQLGEEMGNYMLAQTGETNENGLPTEPGRINGGFFQYEDKEGFRVPSIVVQVENLDVAMEEVKKNGGLVFNGPMDIPGIGIFASIKDTEGNVVGMLQSMSQMS